MWCIVYANKTSGDLIAEYDLNSSYIEKRAIALDEQEDIVRYGMTPVFGWRAFWYCLTRKTRVVKGWYPTSPKGEYRIKNLKKPLDNIPKL